MTDTVQKFLEDVESCKAERDLLVQTVAKNQTEIDTLNRLIKQISDDRDYYMRFSTTLATHLRSIQAIINDAVNEAKQQPHDKKIIPLNSTQKLGM